MQWLTLRKGAYCAVHPRLWPQLAGGVAPAIEHTTALQRFAFRTVVDVGANRGQFAMLARALFPDAYIFAFEPLAAPAKLFRRYLDGDGRIHLFDNAIGERAGARTIFVATQDDSSSLLQPTKPRARSSASRWHGPR